MNVVYVSWNGDGVDYLQSLFFPIFERLKGRDIHVRVLQYRWGTPESIAQTRAAAEAAGLPYHVRPVYRRLGASAATLWSVPDGAVTLARLLRRYRPDVVMPRALIPAAMTLLGRQLGPRVPLVYEGDGLVADERVDFGGWDSNGWPYRILRRVEAAAVRTASAVVTRSTRSARLVAERAGVPGPPASLGPSQVTTVGERTWATVFNGRDTTHFVPVSAEQRASGRAELHLPLGAPLLVYAGSLGPQYHPGGMLRLLANVRQHVPEATLLVLSPHADALLEQARHQGLEDVITRSVSPAEVARYVALADVGVALREPSFSQQGVAPIKVGEYLLCGVPVVATAGVGDLDTVLSPETGVVLEGVNERELARAADWIVGQWRNDDTATRQAARTLGTSAFGLDACVDAYEQAIRAAVMSSSRGAQPRVAAS